MSKISRSLAQNTVLQIAGKALGTLLSLATFAVLLRYLEIDGFGALTKALNFGAIFAILVDLGLTLTATQMISEPGADEEEILGNMLTLRLVSSVLFLSGGAALVFAFPYTMDVKIAAAVSCLAFLFGSVSTVFVGAFQKRLSLGSAVLAETANRVVVLCAALSLLVLPRSIVAASAVFVLGGIVQVVITLIAVRRHLALKPRASLAVWKRILVRSWPIALSIAFNLVYLKGDILFMSLFGRSDTEIGLYGAAYKVVDVVTTVPIMFMGLMLPLLTLAWASRKRADFSAHLQRSFDALSLIALPFALGTLAVGGPVLALIDKDLLAAGPVLAILGFATCAVFYGSLFGHAVVAVQKQKGMIFGYFFVAVVATLGYILFIPNYGMLAAAWVTLASEVLIAIIAAVVVLATSKTRLSPRLLIASLAASVIMYLVITLIPLPHVALSVLLGIGIYATVLPLFGGPSPKKFSSLVLPERV